VAAEAAAAAVAAERQRVDVADAVAPPLRRRVHSVGLPLRFLPFPGLRPAQHQPLLVIPRQRQRPVLAVVLAVALLLAVRLKDKQAEAVDEAVQPRPLRQRARL
jgi:hypothetical protein